MTERKRKATSSGQPARVSRLWPELDPDDWRDLRQVAREELDRRRYEDSPRPAGSPVGWAGGQ